MMRGRKLEALVTSADKIVGAGIDAPLFWRRDGDRIVDVISRWDFRRRRADR